MSILLIHFIDRMYFPVYISATTGFTNIQKTFYSVMGGIAYLFCCAEGIYDKIVWNKLTEGRWSRYPTIDKGEATNIQFGQELLIVPVDVSDFTIFRCDLLENNRIKKSLNITLSAGGKYTNSV